MGVLARTTDALQIPRTHFVDQETVMLDSGADGAVPSLVTLAAQAALRRTVDDVLACSSQPVAQLAALVQHARLLETENV